MHLGVSFTVARRDYEQYEKTFDFRLSTFDFRLSTFDFRLSTFDFRLSTFDYSNPFIICAILLSRSFTFANTVPV